MLLFDRTASVVTAQQSFTYARDEGPRIAFDLQRSIRGEVDQGTIRIWNLPKDVTDRIVADQDTFRSNVREILKARFDDKERARRLKTTMESHIVELWAGYGDSPQLMFRGDPITIRPRIRDGRDYITEIDIGDGYVVLNEQQLAKSFGVGETPANLLAFMSALVDADGDDGKIRASIGLLAPNAVTARLANGWVGQGRPIENISSMADLLGLYWWVRDGKIEFIERNKYLPDFAVRLDAKTNLISTGRADDGRTRFFQCLLAPQIHPGRAVEIIDEDGTVFRSRVLQTTIAGDTHGDEWYINGICGDVGVASGAFLPVIDTSGL